MIDSEFEFFRKLLQDREQQIMKNIKSVDDELRELSSQRVTDADDCAVSSQTLVVERAIIEQQSNEYDQILVALKKIDAKEYGICAMCEEDVGVERLKVKPHAIYCKDCREIIEKTERKD